MWLSTFEIDAAQFRSVTEIAPSEPFLCVNRNPVFHDVCGGAKAIHWVNIALAYIIDAFCSRFLERCDIPLGAEDGRLPDVAFTASSIWNAHYAAFQGRLNAMRSGSRYGSWIARYNNRRQWFQIDLGNRAVIIKCVTQGRYDANQWVKSYTVSYGMNGFHFQFYKEGGRTRVCVARWGWCICDFMIAVVCYDILIKILIRVNIDSNTRTTTSTRFSEH